MQTTDNKNDSAASKDNHKNQTEAAVKERIRDAKEHVAEAHEAAMDDIAQDADLSIHSPNDDLDEGETARLGEDKTDLV